MKTQGFVWNTLDRDLATRQQLTDAILQLQRAVTQLHGNKAGAGHVANLEERLEDVEKSVFQTSKPTDANLANKCGIENVPAAVTGAFDYAKAAENRDSLFVHHVDGCRCGNMLDPRCVKSL